MKFNRLAFYRNQVLRNFCSELEREGNYWTVTYWTEEAILRLRIRH